MQLSSTKIRRFTRAALAAGVGGIVVSAGVVAVGPAAATPRSQAAATSRADAAPPASRLPAEPSTCSTESSTPTYAGRVPSPSSSLGFDLGRRKASVDQINRYLTQVDRASRQVTTATYGASSTGAPMRYALVGRPEVLAKASLRGIGKDVAALREPTTPAATVRAITRRSPMILWIAGNIHGNEPASSDAQLRVLYELADRTDCVAQRVLDNALVVIVPTQNPDGRTAGTRANAYGFDMNRDWFARTQRETRERLALMRALPPQLFVDQHGMGGKGYFFPPNADPIYHEISKQTLSWIDGIYGTANAAAFTAAGYAFETYEAGFDLLFPGYGDTSPILDFGAAGMTFEVGQEAPFADQVDKHYTSAMATLFAAAGRRAQVLGEYHRQFVEATAQGRACTLQPNHVDNPGNVVRRQVPAVAVCGYALRSDDPAKRRELASLVGRLQDDGVRVYRLDAPVHVRDFTAYGRAEAAATLPKGTYWIPMDQPQKHWIQAMLNEDTYVPFPYFYDVSGWSLPLTANIAGGYAGSVPKVAMTRLPRQVPPRAPLPAGVPNVGILTASASPLNPNQSTGWLRWRLEQDWRMPSTTYLASQMTAANLAPLDVLVVPDIDGKALDTAMGAGGNAALKTWVNAGGRLITWKGGTRYAALAGLSSSILREPKSDVPGALFRVKVASDSPLTKGVGETAWATYQTDPVMTAGKNADVLVSYPKADSPDWFVSGYQAGAAEIGGTAAVVDERSGRGSVTSFSFEPNFRGATDGTAKLVYAAVVASRGTIEASRSAVAAPQVSEARPSMAGARALAPRPEYAQAVVRVAPAQAAQAAAIARRSGAAVTLDRSSSSVSVLVIGAGSTLTPGAAVRELPERLRRAGVAVRSVATP